jgi:hemoglobin
MTCTPWLRLMSTTAAAATSLALMSAMPVFAQDATPPGEKPLTEPVKGDPATNAGATPIQGDAVIKAFHGKDGVYRVVNDTIDRGMADPRISDIFKSHDIVRLKRTLSEQVCYLIGGPCVYSGKDMAVSHKDMGLQVSDMNALVEDLQLAMDKEGVPFRAQNQLLAKLAPMKHEVVTR